MKATFDNAVSVLKKLISFASVEGEPSEGAPFGRENADALDYALAVMRGFGFRTKNLEGFCGWAEIGEDELFGVLSHLDVVPVSKGWRHPPFAAEIEDGILYGRGALDDKGPAVAAMFAAAALLEEGYRPTKRLRFIFGCNEESGWRCIERYQKTEEMPTMGFSPDADFPVINCEKGVVYHTYKLPLPRGVYSIASGTRANIVPDLATACVEALPNIEQRSRELGISCLERDDKFVLSARGISAHGSTPNEGKNALVTLLGLLGEFYPPLRAVYSAFKGTDGSGVGLALSDEKSGSLTLNLGVASSDDNLLTFTFDIRHPLCITKDEVTAHLKERLQGGELTQGYYHLPLYVAPENELVRELLASYDGIMGTKSLPITIGGGTYARVLPLGVAFGPIFPGEKSTIHQTNECISLKNFELLIRIYKDALKRLCFAK